jgi:hypothetical protein
MQKELINEESALINYVRGAALCDLGKRGSTRKLLGHVGV